MKAKSASQSPLFEPVEEDAADAAHLVAVLQEEILVAPFLVAVIVGDRVAGAGGVHRGVEIDRVRVGLGAPAVEHRRQVGAAAEPLPAGHDHARVHVDGRHMRIPRMGDQRDAARPEARVVLGAGDLLAEFGREFAVDGRDVDADLLEDAAVQHRHDATAAVADSSRRAAVQGVLTKRPAAVASERRAGRQIVLDRLEGGENPVAQLAEPRRGARLSSLAGRRAQERRDLPGRRF